MSVHSGSAFGALLQRYRLAAGFTQEYLAERAEMSTRGISDLERGLTRKPHVKTARRIADALELTPYDRATFVEAARRGAIEPAPPPPTQHVPAGGYLGAVPVGPLIGRERELTTLDAVLSDVLGSEGRFVLLSGEPGVGKTRPAQEMMLRLQRRGVLVATGRCYGAEESAPYYPFLDVLSRLYRSAPAQVRDAVPDQWPYLIRLLPGEKLATSPVIGDSLEQQRLFRAVSGFVLALSDEIPVALLIDDLHWADRATLNLLRHLIRQSRAHRVLLLGTVRDDDPGLAERLTDAILDLARERLVERVALARLDLEETISMLRALLGEVEDVQSLGRELHDRSEGNPLFTEELVRALIERGDLSQLDGTWRAHLREEVPLPATIQALAQQRLSRLSHRAQRIVQDASVLGQIFDFEELRLLTGRSEIGVDDALDESRAAGLVRIVDRSRYTFRHALIHSALAADLSPTRKRRLHLQAGSILESLPAERREGRASEIALHFREGEDRVRTLRWTVAAGEEAESIFAHRRAGYHYRLALDLLEDASNREEAQRTVEQHVLIRLGHVSSVAARYDEAVEALSKAISLAANAGDLEYLARAAAGIAQVHRYRGTPAEGIELLGPLLAQLDQEGVLPATGASMYIALANLFFAEGRYDELLWAAERAVAWAREAGDDRILAEAEGRYGLALIHNCRLDEAQAELERAVTRAEATNHLDSLARALNNLGSIAWNEGRLEDQLRYAQRCLAAAERLDDQNYLIFALSNLGGAYMVLGQWAKARDWHLRALEQLKTVGSSSYAAYPYTALAGITCFEGDLDEGIQLAEKALMLAERAGADIQVLAFIERDLGDAHRLRGRPDISRDRLEAMHQRLGDRHSSTIRILPALAEAYLALGEYERAMAAADQAAALAAERNHYLVRIDTLRLQGAVLSRMDRWAEAETLLREAVTRARARSYPLGLARALDELGQVLIHRGERRRAAEALSEAQEVFHTLGAAAFYRD